MPVTLIVARAHHSAIGRGNTLPWRLPEDLRHFKSTTMGHPIVMGRKTFDSIGKPLPGRHNIVVSRDAGWHHDGCERAGSVEEALRRAAVASSDDASAETFVIGGAQVYAAALPLADRLLVTEIDLDVEADVFFPAIDPAQWAPRHTTRHRSSAGIDYAIVDYRRRSDAPR